MAMAWVMGQCLPLSLTLNRWSSVKRWLFSCAVILKYFVDEYRRLLTGKPTPEELQLYSLREIDPANMFIITAVVILRHW